MPKETCLILTATIDPDGMDQLVITNPEIRLRQYREAFRLFLLDEAVNRIVFCENSGHDLKELRQAASSHSRPGLEIEFLSFKSPKFPRRLGKGYGEMLILTTAFKRSRLIRSSEWFVKCTGRLHVRNFERFVQFFAKQDRPDVSSDLSANLAFADSRFFFFKRPFFQKLSGYQNWLDDSRGQFFEHALARTVHQEIATGGRWEPLPWLPRIKGFSATKGGVYKSNAFSYWPREMRYQIKRWAYGISPYGKSYSFWPENPEKLTK